MGMMNPYGRYGGPPSPLGAFNQGQAQGRQEKRTDEALELEKQKVGAAKLMAAAKAQDNLRAKMDTRTKDIDSLIEKGLWNQAAIKNEMYRQTHGEDWPYPPEMLVDMRGRTEAADAYLSELPDGTWASEETYNQALEGLNQRLEGLPPSVAGKYRTRYNSRGTNIRQADGEARAADQAENTARASDQDYWDQELKAVLSSIRPAFETPGYDPMGKKSGLDPALTSEWASVNGAATRMVKEGRPRDEIVAALFTMFQDHDILGERMKLTGMSSPSPTNPAFGVRTDTQTAPTPGGTSTHEEFTIQQGNFDPKGDSPPDNPQNKYVFDPDQNQWYKWVPDQSPPYVPVTANEAQSAGVAADPSLGGTNQRFAPTYNHDPRTPPKSTY